MNILITKISVLLFLFSIGSPLQILETNEEANFVWKGIVLDNIEGNYQEGFEFQFIVQAGPGVSVECTDVENIYDNGELVGSKRKRVCILNGAPHCEVEWIREAIGSGTCNYDPIIN